MSYYPVRICTHERRSLRLIAVAPCDIWCQIRCSSQDSYMILNLVLVPVSQIFLVYFKTLWAITWTNGGNWLVEQSRRQGVRTADYPLVSNAVRVAHCSAIACASGKIGKCINEFALSCVSRKHNWERHSRQICRWKLSNSCGCLATEQNGGVIEEQSWFN